MELYTVMLTPLEDVPAPAFCLMCKQMGSNMVYTEFVLADALICSVSKTGQKLNVGAEERPVRKHGHARLRARACQEISTGTLKCQYGHVSVEK